MDTKKLLILTSPIALLVLFLIYLLVPSQPVAPLPDSLKSIEPGDTIQIPGISAYYSQHEREFVTKYYQDQFAPRIFGIKLPTYRLNHPPEYSREKFKDTIFSSYMEEVVVPFRESLFINGWEPDVFFKGNASALSRYTVLVDDKKYFSKATLRPFYASTPAKVVNFAGVIFSTFVLYFLAKKIIFERKND